MDLKCAKSGAPFYSHPLEVAYMCLKYIFKTEVIVAAILHDVVEDTDVTIEMVKVDFGWRVAEMVEMLTRDKEDGRKLSIEELFESIYQKGDEEVMLIKLLDRIDNLDTLYIKSSEKQLQTSKETLKNFLILAEIIGKPELSELIYHKCSDINKNLRPKDNFHKLGEEFRLPSPSSQSILH